MVRSERMLIMRIVITLVVICGSLFSATAQNIEVVIKEMRSAKGQIVIGIYKDQDGFKENNPIDQKIFQKKEQSGEMVVKFNLAPGTYGFSLVDDENSDDEMEFNFLGMPKEGFGFSNFYLTSLSRPTFEDFKFTVTENQKQKVVMRIKYM